MSENFEGLFNDETKKICICSFSALLLTVIFILSPLSSLFITSTLFKIAILVILVYTIHINIKQTNQLSNTKQSALSENITKQIEMNILCSYIFTFFLILLFLFVMKSLFHF
jgi:hypothetical protein